MTTAPQNPHIGRPQPRTEARRLASGGGRYLDDIVRPGTLHAAFLRSPYAHARLRGLDTLDASVAPGVVAVFTGDDVNAVCAPWSGVLQHPPGMVSPPQYALVQDRAAFQGEPVAIVIARSHAEAEDACDRIVADWEVLPAITTLEDAASDANLAHPELASNTAFQSLVTHGDAAAAFARTDVVVVEETLEFSGITAVAMEPRGVLADFDAATRRLEVWSVAQSPFQFRDLVARHFDLSEVQIAVHSPDVGGAFGVKLHTYSDEMATIAASVLLGRPVKFLADRMESFQSDVQARRQKVRGRMTFDSSGQIVAMEVDVLAAAGAYSVYPRTSFLEPNQVARIAGGPYVVPNYAAKMRSVFLNTAPSGQLRGVGHPVACAITEALMEQGASVLGIDPIALRRRNLIPPAAFPYVSHGGFKFENLGQDETLERLAKLTADAAMDDQPGLLTGIGRAIFVELTSPGIGFYSHGGAHIATRDSATIRLESDGTVSLQSALSDQGQGGPTVLAQIVADTFGVPIEGVRVISGTTLGAPMGGGAWASRGASIAGEAAHRAASALKARVITLAQSLPDGAGCSAVDIADGFLIDAKGQPVMPLHELARLVHYRPDLAGDGGSETLTATGTYYHADYPYTFTQGGHAARVTVNPRTGVVRLDGLWIVADCGTVLNPLLADEQVRGAAAMGIGAALWEECQYGQMGDLLTATMADYLTPMSCEMPDIVVDHMSTPTRQTALGAKGAGESGIAGVQAAILNAVNDALRPTGARISQFPITPERVWIALQEAARPGPSA